MTNSQPLVAIIGYLENESRLPGHSLIITAAGEKILVETENILSTHAVEAAGEKGLKRIFIDQEASVWLGVTLKTVVAGHSSGIGTATALKWLDDGGTISKSRDDTLAPPL